MNPEPLNAPQTIVSPRLPLTMPTHQLIPPILCTRGRLRNEPNFTGRSRNTPTNIIYETKPIPSRQHRRPLTLNTRQHENTKRTQFRPQPVANTTHLPPQANPIPSQSYSHAASSSPSPFAHLLYWHFPCSESASRLPPLVSCISASKRSAAKPVCVALNRPSES